MNNTQADSALEKFAAAWDAVVHIGGSEQAVMIMEAVGDKVFGQRARFCNREVFPLPPARLEAWAW